MSKKAGLTIPAILKINQLSVIHIFTLIGFLGSNRKVPEKHINYITTGVLHDSSK